MKYLKTTLAVSAAGAALGLTSPIQAYDLMDAYRDARTYDAAVASSRAQRDASKEKIDQANAAFKPTVTGTGALGYQLLDTNIGTWRKGTTQSYGIALTYPLYRVANKELLEQSKIGAAIAELSLAQAEQDLLVRVSQAYFDVLISQENLIAIQAQKTAIAEQLAAAKRNFEVGTATITDQQEAQARFDLIISQEIVASNDMVVKVEALQTLTGKAPPALHDMKSSVALIPPTPNKLADWVVQAREAAFPVQTSALNLLNAKYEIDRQAAGNKPTLDAVSNLSWTRSGSGSAPPLGVNSRIASIGLSLSVPFYNGGVVDSRVRESISLQEKARADNESAKRTSESATRALFIKLNSSLAQIKALEAAEKSSQLALDSNQLGYQVGVRINIDVLNAQQQLFTTRRDLARARYEYLVDSIRLKQTVAALKDVDIASINALLTAPAPAKATLVK